MRYPKPARVSPHPIEQLGYALAVCGDVLVRAAITAIAVAALGFLAGIAVGVL